jgi:DNA-binding SARP family transcriptional activator
MSARFHLALLGGFRMRQATGVPVVVASKKAQGLLAYLAIRPGQPHSRAKLSTLLWSEAPAEQARNSLRQTLFTLRHALSASRSRQLLAVGDTIALDPAAIEVDVVAFERLVTEATSERLAKAAALYAGDLLEGLEISEPAFEEWLITERERLRELALGALSRLVNEANRAGATEREIRMATRLLALDPLQEPAHRTLMRLYAGLGRRAHALRQYQLCVAALSRELGVEPEAETQRLYRDILLQAGRARGEERATGGRGGSARRSRFESPGVTAPPDWPLVGRTGELAHLRQVLAAAWRDGGRAVLVIGEAGVGKTRLVETLMTEATRRGGRVVIGRAHETEQLLPFRPWVDALRGDGAVREIAGREELRPVWRERLAVLWPELGDAPREISTAPEESVRLLEAVTEMVGRLAVRQVLVLVLEDLHWADDMSVRLLGFLVRRLGTRPALVVGTVREEELAASRELQRVVEDLERTGHLTRLSLSSLSRSDAQTLVRALAKPGCSPAAVTRIGERVWTASEGNPFVVVETMRALREGEAPLDRGDASLPARVRDVVAARLDRLDERARHVLTVAAVIGPGSSFPLIQRVAGLDERATAEGVEELVRRRILQTVGERFELTHDWIRQVAYERLLAPRRRALHAAVGRALEELYAERGEEIYDRLAHHFARADVIDPAVSYLVRFSEQATRRYALEDAVRALREARSFVERLPADIRDRGVVDVTLRLATSLYFLGRYQEIVTLLDGERDRLGGLCDPRLTGPYHFWLGYAHGLLGDQDRAATHLRLALEEAKRCGDNVTRGQAHCGLARDAFWGGCFREGVAHGREAVECLSRSAERWWLGQAYWTLGINHAFLGEFAPALTAQKEAQAIGDALGDSRLQSFAAWSTGWVGALMGDREAAIEACTRAVAVAPDPTGSALAGSHLGFAYLAQGDTVRAVPLLTEAVAQVERLRLSRSLGRVVGWLAEAYFQMGDAARAGALGTRALGLTTAAKHSYGIGEAQRLLARVARASGDLDATVEWLRKAVWTFESIEARFEVGRTRVFLGEVLASRGARDAAEAEVRAARTLFDEIGVPPR